MLIRSFDGAAARLAFAVFATLAFFGTAEAQYITYVATNGNDANACTVITAPCKTLQRAVNVTSANGTVRVLTPLISSVFINKSITIEGVRPTIVGQITIGGGTTAVVTLRGLALDGVGGYVNGIRIDSAAAVHIEDCTVERYTDSGIKLDATTATELFVSNTVSRDNGYAGLYVSDANAQVAVADSRFERNVSYGIYTSSAKANITRSIASENNHGIVAGGKTTLTETTAANNASIGFFIDLGGATFIASVATGNLKGLEVQSSGSAMISDSVFTDNGIVGIFNAGTVTITDSVITSNPTGIDNQGSLYTRQNNDVGGVTSGNAKIPYSAY